MVAIDFLNAAAPSKSIVEMHGSPTSNDEYMTDAVFDESRNNVIGNAYHAEVWFLHQLNVRWIASPRGIHTFRPNDDWDNLTDGA